ncbi:hypothetical protein HDU98_007077 [Podochytrium sp. JEL0797]|nr:hypothetical protein HDU98_007077 [Podochytrium sp. JEL0797]
MSGLINADFAVFSHPIGRSIQSFSEFYPFYLGEHRNRTSRRLHFIGTTLFLGISATAVAYGKPELLLPAVVSAYSFAWIGHFGFEKNRPATFKYPVWSLMGDFRLYFETLSGQRTMFAPPMPYGGFMPPPQQRGFMPPTQQQRPPSSESKPNASASNPSLDKLTTAFVSSIASTTSDEWITKLLKNCGDLKTWTRVTSLDSTPLPCGFATFETSLPIHHLLRCLAKETPLLLKGHPLIVRVDVGARAAAVDAAARIVAEKGLAPLEEEERAIEEKVEKYLKETGMWTEDVEMTEATGDDAAQFLSTLGVDAAAAGAGEGGKQAPRGPAVAGQKKRVYNEETEEEEIRRLEKREREMHQAYLERMARFERQESHRIHNLESSTAKLETTRLQKQHAREHMMILLSTYDDDAEIARGEQEFYRDRARWIFKRNPLLRRERDIDNRDRFLEREEMEIKQKEIMENTREEREMQALREKEMAELERQQLEEQERVDRLRQEREAEQRERQQEVYHAVAGGHGVVVGRIMTMEERKKAIAELVSSLPTTLDDIERWDVKWDFLEGGGEVVRNKIQAFVAKKVVETLGDESPEIVEFVMTNVGKRKSARFLVEELTKLLDEEAEVFVCKLWRMVMYESESRAPMPHHLYVLHHGLWGDETHMQFIIASIQAKETSNVEFLNCNLNTGTNSYGGVDGCGAQLAEQLFTRLADETKPTVTHISFIGYSFGGLVIRYVVGVLFARGLLRSEKDAAPADDSRPSLIANLFVTFASPHLGARRTTPESAFNPVFNHGAGIFTAKTGRQMMGVDRTEVQGRKTVDVLADPGLPFWQGLAKFKRRILYANLQNDPLVSHRTASISPLTEPSPKPILKQLTPVSEKYPSLVVFDPLSPPSLDPLLEEPEPVKSLREKIAIPLFFSVFICIALVALGGRRLFWNGISAVRGVKRMIGSGAREEVKWNDVHGLHSFAWVPQGGSEGEGDVDTERYAFEKLNELEWERVHVRSEFRRAHATIVRRSEGFKGNEDVVGHFVDVYVFEKVE